MNKVDEPTETAENGSHESPKKKKKSDNKSVPKVTDEGFVEEIAGYMPLREDFVVEYDNDAEILLADMEFNDYDTAADIELKHKILKIYNEKLDERFARRKFVHENGLLDLKKYEAELKKSKEERDICLKMRPFMKYLNPQQYQELVEGLIEENKLVKKLNEIQSGHSKQQKSVSKKSVKTKPKEENEAECDLNDKEKVLCIMLDIHPNIYYDIKKKIISKLGKQKISKSEILELANKEIEKEKVWTIYKYLEHYEIQTGRLPN